MSRNPKVTPARGQLRKPATSLGVRNFPAWVDGDARAIPLSATVESRVRDSLVLRIVTKAKTMNARGPSDVRRVR